MRKGNIYIAGVMTGTSADGIDISLLSFRKGAAVTWEAVMSATVPFPPNIFREIIAFQEMESMGKGDYLKFSAVLGNHVAEKVSLSLERFFRGRIPVNVAMAYHGQTIAHFPRKVRVGRRRYSSTLQAGESAIAARIGGITVVSDFRQADIAAGGSGAPLTPPFHAFLLRGMGGTSGFVNIGGISNVTVVRRARVVTASDTGPGNMLIDGAMRFFTGGRKRYDRDGRLASRGRVSARLLEFIRRRDGFLLKRKPASTGREHYGDPFLREILSFSRREKVSSEDVIATLTWYTAFSISKFLRERRVGKISNVYVGGGGAKNATLMSFLSELLPAENVLSSSGLGLDPEYVEPAAFAYLGFCCLSGIRVDTSSFTGGGKIIPGKITPGDNFREMMKSIHGP